MHSLPVFLRLSDRPVILVGHGPAADAKRRLLQRAGARVVDEDETLRDHDPAEGRAILAVVAVDDGELAEAAVVRLRSRGLLINAVDRPALCDFTFPAIVDRDPVLLAVGTGGASAGLAKALRQRIEALLPAGLGQLAVALQTARPAIRTRFPDADARRDAIDAALQGPLDLFRPLEPNAVARWLADPASRGAAVVRITLRSEDPDDLTLGEARWLSRADTVYHEGTLVRAILNRVRADAVLIAGSVPETPPAGVTIILEGPLPSSVPSA